MGISQECHGGCGQAQESCARRGQGARLQGPLARTRHALRHGRHALCRHVPGEIARSPFLFSLRVLVSLSLRFVNRSTIRSSCSAACPPPTDQLSQPFAEPLLFHDWSRARSPESRHLLSIACLLRLWPLCLYASCLCLPHASCLTPHVSRLKLDCLAFFASIRLATLFSSTLTQLFARKLNIFAQPARLTAAPMSTLWLRAFTAACDRLKHTTCHKERNSATLRKTRLGWVGE